MSDMYLTAVDRAIGAPGTWVEIPRPFRTRANAAVTGRCLEGGYLRVAPGDGATAFVVAGKRCLRTAGPVESRLRQVDDTWRLEIQAPT
jgi:hypothetical protein